MLIVNYFRRKPSEKSLVKVALRNMRPDYRKFINDRRVDSFEDLIYYGQKFERELDQDAKYLEPRPQTEMTIKEAAFAEEAPCKKRQAAVTENPPRKKGNGKNVAQSQIVTEMTTSTATPPPTGNPEASQDTSPPQTPPPNRTFSTPNQRPPRPFPRECFLCREYGHRAFHCPTRGNRDVCWGCGGMGIRFPACIPCQEKKKNGGDRRLASPSSADPQ